MAFGNGHSLGINHRQFDQRRSRTQLQCIKLRHHQRRDQRDNSAYGQGQIDRPVVITC